MYSRAHNPLNLQMVRQVFGPGLKLDALALYNENNRLRNSIRAIQSRLKQADVLLRRYVADSHQWIAGEVPGCADLCYPEWTATTGKIGTSCVVQCPNTSSVLPSEPGLVVNETRCFTGEYSWIEDKMQKKATCYQPASMTTQTWRLSADAKEFVATGLEAPIESTHPKRMDTNVNAISDQTDRHVQPQTAAASQNTKTTCAEPASWTIMSTANKINNDIRDEKLPVGSRQHHDSARDCNYPWVIPSNKSNKKMRQVCIPLTRMPSTLNPYATLNQPGAQAMTGIGEENGLHNEETTDRIGASHGRTKHAVVSDMATLADSVKVVETGWAMQRADQTGTACITGKSIHTQSADPVNTAPCAPGLPALLHSASPLGVKSNLPLVEAPRGLSATTNYVAPRMWMGDIAVGGAGTGFLQFKHSCRLVPAQVSNRLVVCVGRHAVVRHTCPVHFVYACGRITSNARVVDKQTTFECARQCATVRPWTQSQSQTQAAAGVVNTDRPRSSHDVRPSVVQERTGESTKTRKRRKRRRGKPAASSSGIRLCARSCVGDKSQTSRESTESATPAVPVHDDTKSSQVASRNTLASGPLSPPQTQYTITVYSPNQNGGGFHHVGQEKTNLKNYVQRIACNIDGAMKLGASVVKRALPDVQTSVESEPTVCVGAGTQPTRREQSSMTVVKRTLDTGEKASGSTLIEKPSLDSYVASCMVAIENIDSTPWAEYSRRCHWVCRQDHLNGCRDKFAMAWRLGRVLRHTMACTSVALTGLEWMEVYVSSEQDKMIISGARVYTLNTRRIIAGVLAIGQNGCTNHELSPSGLGKDQCNAGRKRYRSNQSQKISNDSCAKPDFKKDGSCAKCATQYDCLDIYVTRFMDLWTPDPDLEQFTWHHVVRLGECMKAASGTMAGFSAAAALARINEAVATIVSIPRQMYVIGSITRFLRQDNVPAALTPRVCPCGSSSCFLYESAGSSCRGYAVLARLTCPLAVHHTRAQTYGIMRMIVPQAHLTPAAELVQRAIMWFHAHSGVVAFFEGKHDRQKSKHKVQDVAYLDMLG